MRVSINTIKQYTDLSLPTPKLVEKINQQLGGVEAITDLGERYKDAVVAKVVSCEKHPNADKLSVCMIDTGQADHVQVVCGATNVREGLFVVWLPPGSTVPATYEDKEPFVLTSRELRGVMSHGMLASARELGLGDDHHGILEIDPTQWIPSGLPVEPGAKFAPLYGLDDTLIDIENKMFTHRPDCFGQIGVAREIAGIQQKPFSSPKWYVELPPFTSGEGVELKVQNTAIENVPRFMAVAIKDVQVAPSPLWLQCELVRLGAKPINNIVDVTNYVMLLTSQPTHAYDFDKLRDKTLGARVAKNGEKLTLLNGKEYTLTDSDIVIVDGQGPVGLGGIMGGGNSEVSASTTNIVLECANFDMYTMRRTSMRHGLFTDALTRFNKGQSALQNEYVLGLLIQSVFDVAGGKLGSQIFDIRQEKAIKKHPPVTISPAFINERLGSDLDAKQISKLLENVEFVVEEVGAKPKQLKIHPPFWRTDIQLPEDIVEEVGRLYGFDKLPRELPKRSMNATAKNQLLELKQAVRHSLSRAGANEVLTYSFVHEKVLINSDQDPKNAFRLSNAISPDLQYYRLSVLPSLLDKVHPNIKNGYDQFCLFEIGKGHEKENIDSEGLPSESQSVELVYASNAAAEGAAFYHAKQIVATLVADLGVKVRYEKIEKSSAALQAPYELSRSARIVTLNGEPVGIVGELKRRVQKAFKLPAYTSAATLDIDALNRAEKTTQKNYRSLSRFPKVSQDISLRVSKTISYADVTSVIDNVLGSTAFAANGYVDFSPLTIYRPGEGDEKTYTFHIEVTSYEKTLKDSEVSTLLGKVAAEAKAKLGAKQV